MQRLNRKLFLAVPTAAFVIAFQPLGQAQSSLSDGTGQHVFYVGTDQHVHQFYSAPNSTAERDVDLFQPGSSSPAFFFGSGAPLASFSDSAGAHVYYFDTLSDLHRLALNAFPYLPVDSSMPTGSFEPNGITSIAAFSDAADENIFFTDQANNVFWLFCPKGGTCNGPDIFPGNPAFGSWSLVPLTQSMGAPPFQSGLTGFVDSAGDHVYYVASNHTVNEFFRAPGGNWTIIPLTDLSLIDTTYGFIFTHFAAPGSPLTAFSDRTGQHVFFVDANQHINQLFQSPGGPWINQDLTAATGAAGTALFSKQLQSPLTSFNNGAGEHVFYVDTFGRVGQLFIPWGGNWVNQPDLGFAPPADHCSGLTSFSDTSGEFVSFISGTHIFQLSWRGGPSWNVVDLTGGFGGPGAHYPCFF